MTRKDLCKSPNECEAAKNYTCTRCGAEWTADIEPDECPECGSREIEVERCPDCPVVKLEAAMASGVGQLISRCWDMFFDMKAGLRYSPDDITFEEARVLRILASEVPQEPPRIL